jgi:hypothetical protein
VKDYYRPVNIMVNRLLFLYPGDSPLFFSILRVVLHCAILAAFLALLRMVFRDDRALWIGGAFYALNPNIHEMFHWANMVAILYFPLAMLGSVLLWIAWCRGRGWVWLLLSLVAYALGVLTYENCVPFCLMFPLAAVLFAEGKRIRGSWLYVLLAAVYVVYRFTHGFGWGVASIHGGSYFGEGSRIRIWDILQNVRAICSWWIGGLGATAFLGGFNAFAMLVPKVQIFCVAVSIGLIWFVWRRARRSWESPVSMKSTDEMALKGGLFGLAWFLLSYAPHLLFAPASRHNILPVFGAGMALAAFLLRWRPRISGGTIGALALLCLIANMGNALAWRDAGVFCRRLYHHLERTQPEWGVKNLVVFDTEALRERQTPGVLTKRQDGVATWAQYRNAILMRGFVGTGMMQLCMDDPPPGIQDTECGTRRTGDMLEWHDRYNPAVPHRMPLAQIYWVDCLAAATDSRNEY